MPIAAGTRFGVYELIAPIGAGGMGEVYRARDTRLDRDVALKILPDAFARDPERLARFKREAQILASLNHPHSGGIYSVEEGFGISALALELVEGPTLAERCWESSRVWCSASSSGDGLNPMPSVTVLPIHTPDLRQRIDD